MTDTRRELPSVSALLETVTARSLLSEHPRARVVDAIRRAIDEVRRSGTGTLTDDDWSTRIRSGVKALDVRSLRPVFNATGVILHTNLGRAPLAQSAAAAALTAETVIRLRRRLRCSLRESADGRVELGEPRVSS